MDNFRFLRKRGEGTFAEVWEVEDRQTRRRAALKVLKKKFSSIVEVFNDAEFRTLRAFSCRPSDMIHLSTSSSISSPPSEKQQSSSGGRGGTSSTSPPAWKQSSSLFSQKHRPSRSSSSSSKTAIKPAIFHPHLTGLYDAFFEPRDGRVVFVLELLGPSLLDEVVERKACRSAALIRRSKPLFHEGELRVLLFQILSGINDLHSRGIFHRDIKPENILFQLSPEEQEVADGRRRRTTTHSSSTLKLKLADFGSCQFTHKQQSSTASPATPTESSDSGGSGAYTEYIATRWYRSPECLLTAGHYGPPMDLWATGCVAIELLTGLPFFPGENETHQLQLIHNAFGSPSRQEVERHIGPIGVHIASSANFKPKLRMVSPPRLKTGEPPIAPPSGRTAATMVSSNEGGESVRRGKSSRWTAKQERRVIDGCLSSTTTTSSSSTCCSSCFTSFAAPLPTFPRGKYWRQQVLPRILGGSISASLSDLLHRLLAYFPSQRITAGEALKHPFFSDLDD